MEFDKAPTFSEWKWGLLTYNVPSGGIFHQRACCYRKYCQLFVISADERNFFKTVLGIEPQGKLEEISNAYAAEDRINNLRNNLRDEEIESIESDRKNYQTSVYYMDIVSQLETMGDFLINISQTLYKTNTRIS